MKDSSAEIPWDEIKIIGFDMDGTLYDEFDFIIQVYAQIAKLFSNSESDESIILEKMLLKWLANGSSYPFIFTEVLTEIGVNISLHEEKIKEALLIFRNFMPVISLSNRVKFLLGVLKKQYELFLISDGSSTLQWNKIRALSLENYFHKQNIYISGDFGKGAEKPALMSLKYVQVFRGDFKANEVVFIGDRDVDKQFAKEAGFYFIQISNNINTLILKK